MISLSLRRLDWLRDWRTWLAWGGLLLVGVLGLWFFGAQVAPQEGMGPVEIFQHWLERTRIWETILSQQSSGWMHKVFSGLPGHIYGWIILLYGIVQPFLPAAYCHWPEFRL